MSHSIADNDSSEIVDADDPYRGLRAKPEKRFARGIEPERIFGICADELDDNFVEDAMAIRRAERAQGGKP